MTATHQIIDVVTGVKPFELRFESEDAARVWLASYGVSESYKQEHYQIIPITSIHLSRKASTLRDGVACEHPGCLRHISHPCEGCGRIGGQARTN